MWAGHSSYADTTDLTACGHPGPPHPEVHKHVLRLDRINPLSGETQMADGAKVIVYPVSDLENAKKLFTSLLGVEPYVDGTYYVGYKTDGQEIGLDPHGKSSGPIAYWETGDIAAKLGELTAAGWETKAEPRNVGGGMLVASVTDANQNVIGLRQNP